MFDPDPQPVGALGLWFLFVTCAFLPWAVWRSSKRAKDAPVPPRTKYFVHTIVTAALLGGLALWVASVEDIALFPAAPPSLGTLTWAVAALVALVLGMSRYWQHVARQRERRMQLFCEPTSSDRALWLAVSFSAGFWEEIVYRGVTTVLLARWLGSVPLAIGIAVVAFAISHVHRGVRVAALLGLIAIVLHALVFVAGSLYVAMAVHFLYDVAAGFSYMRLSKKYGITRDAPAAGVIDRADEPGSTRAS